MFRPKTRLHILLGVAIIVLVFLTIATISTKPWLSFLAPIFVAIWSLLFIWHGYFLLRAWRWASRQREERDAVTELAIPAEVKRCEEFLGIETIDTAQKKTLHFPPDYQGYFRAAGILIALLPPLALICLAIQRVFFEEGGPWAAGLVFSEAMFLMLLIHLVWINPDPSRAWVESRIRSELLRREQYLRFASIGPYLTLSPKDEEETRRLRIATLMRCDFQILCQMIPLATAKNDLVNCDRWWIDELWTAVPSGPRLTFPLERMQSYLFYRIRKQLSWFSLGVELNERFEKWTGHILKAAVLCALTAAVIHGVFLLDDFNHSSLIGQATLLLAFVLPPVGAALLAIQVVFAFRALAISYQATTKQLLKLSVNLERTIDSYSTASDATEQRRLEASFQAIVLHSESTITQEMERWIMLVNRAEYEVAV